jgi:hypothetical protein
MTEEHFAAFLETAQAKKDDSGWMSVGEGRHIALYAAANGGSLSITRVQALRVQGGLVSARTTRGDLFAVHIEDIFAASADAVPGATRKAGFV